MLWVVGVGGVSNEVGSGPGRVLGTCYYYREVGGYKTGGGGAGVSKCLLPTSRGGGGYTIF